MFKQILQKTFNIGVATLFSRLLGFLRDILIAFYFGTSYSAGAFFVAFRLPNIWRSFVGEEAVSAAVVPVLSEYHARNDSKSFWGLAYSLIKISFLILSLIAIAGVIFAPGLVRIIAPGFSYNAEKYRLCVTLTRLIFPYILLIGITAIVAGIVMSGKVFWSYSWAPAILNISIISSILFLTGKFGIFSLAYGIIIGGILEVVLQFVALRRLHPDRIKAPLFHPQYKRIFSLLIPRFCGAGIYQINIFIDTILASLEGIVGQGGIAGLYYAQRFVQLPLAVFATAMATAVLPFFSAQATNKSFDKLGENVVLSIRWVLFVMVPASLGLIILGREIIATVFQYGEFTEYSTTITSKALQFYALGLVFYGGIKIMVATFYALQDTLTPVKASLFSLITNVLLSVILMFPLKLSGLCLATSIAAGCNFFILFWKLNKKIDFKYKEVFNSFKRVFISAVLMAVVLIVLKRPVYEFVSFKVFSLLVLLIIASLAYLAASCIFNPSQIKSILKWMKR